MTAVNYINGDATAPGSTGNKIIVHVCNDTGGWGRGFVLAISAKWSLPEKSYRQWYQSKQNFALGKVQIIQVEKDIWVANLVGQRGFTKDKEGQPPVRYEAIGDALVEVALFAKTIHASVHMPRIGCGLAGGNWDSMEPVIVKALCSNEIEVTVYDFV